MPVLNTGIDRRMGDRIPIAGSYQHDALLYGNAAQRSWHASKLQLVDRLLQPVPEEHVLDVGCGSGVCVNHIAGRGARVVGVDANPSAIAFAQETYKSSRAEFRLGYVDELELTPERFDRALCLEVVEHLYPTQVKRLIEGVYQALKPGGRFVISTPNYRSLWPAIECALDLLRLVPALKEEQHVSKFHHNSLQQIVEQAGFQLIARRSVCTFGPWMAPLSTRLARCLTDFELGRRIPAGTILAHLYAKAIRR